LHRAFGDSRRCGPVRDGNAVAADQRPAGPGDRMGRGAAGGLAGDCRDPARLHLAVQVPGRKRARCGRARDGHVADRVGRADDPGRGRGVSACGLVRLSVNPAKWAPIHRNPDRNGRPWLIFAIVHGRRAGGASVVVGPFGQAKQERPAMDLPRAASLGGWIVQDTAKPGATRPATVNAQIVPAGTLDVLSRNEIARLRDATSSGLHALLRSCSLAVLTSGAVQDSARATLDQYPDFDIQVLQQDRGVKLDLKNAPAQAFVDGKIIRGTNELLFAVMRDIVYESAKLESGEFNLDDSSGITHAVFDILRNARVLRARFDPNLVVCWGGHSISREEYDYSKAVGYQLGLRGMDICTGCGPGAMKGPMKGATIAHAKQRHDENRYIGLTEPSIIAAESPNPIVNSLVILPDIEKRLEAFVRVGHGFIVFPGGVGTAEEILYLLGILLNPVNANVPFPLVFTGPKSA